MAFKSRHAWFLAFVAVFAAAAGFVFWGTWALDMVPVMPDCPTSFPADYAADWLRGWEENGKFVPGDVLPFLGGPYFWVELRYVFAAFMAALGMFYFLRGRGLSRLSSYAAGLFLAFSGYWFTLFSAGHLGWFQWMTYGVFAFGLIDRALLKGKVRHWVLLGACVAWASFNQSDLWLCFTVFTAAYFIYRTVASLPRGGWKDSRRTYRRWLLGSLVALATFVVVGLPSFRNAICSDLAGRMAQMESGDTTGANAKEDPEARWKFVTNWSLPPEDTVEFCRRGVHGDTSCQMTLAIGRMRGSGIRPYTGRLGCPLEHENDEIPEGGRYPNYRQHSLYMGWITCLLALFALGAAAMPQFRGRRADTLFLAVAAVLFWILSMGRYCEPAYRIVFHLPFGDLMRCPVKWHHLTEFCVVALSGFGLDALLGFFNGGKRRYPVAVASAACILVVLNVGSLARNDSLYCAPHSADTNVVPLTRQPIPQDPLQAAQFYDAVANQGLRPVGRSMVPVQLQDGSVRELEMLWVEQKVPRPQVRKPGRGLGDVAYTMAVASALATGLVVGYLILSILVRGIGDLKIK